MGLEMRFVYNNKLEIYSRIYIYIYIFRYLSVYFTDSNIKQISVKFLKTDKDLEIYSIDFICSLFIEVIPRKA